MEVFMIVFAVISLASIMSSPTRHGCSEAELDRIVAANNESYKRHLRGE